jgi:hypothetical protein
MNIPENIKERIASLSLKTVRNGATPEEEQSAKLMILRIMERYAPKKDSGEPKETVNIKYGHVQQPYVDRQFYDWKKIAKDYLSPTNFKLFEQTNRMTDDLVIKISWDHVAAEHLKYRNFISYIDQTDPIWALLKKSPDKLSATLEYRRKAYEIFKSF